MKKYVLFLSIFLVFLLIFCLKPAFSQEDEVKLKSPPKNFKWNNFGKIILDKAPQNIKNASELEKARYIMTKVGNELEKQGIRANTSYVDRKIFIGKETGTCGDVSDKLQEVFKGAGIISTGVLGEKSKSTGSVIYRAITDPLDVNQDHGAVAAYVNGKVYVFDLWVHAVLNNKSFTGTDGSLYNGIPAEEWEQVLKKAGYVSFSTLSKENDFGDKMHKSLNDALKGFILDNSLLTQIPQEIRIDADSSWEGILPASKTLELKARIVYSKPAGAANVLEVKVNDIVVSSSLINKNLSFKYKDGRTFSYQSGTTWMIFYSHNFSANNSTAGGGYQVLTNQGEAYRYKWDISSLIENFSKMKVTIKNTGGSLKLPIIVRDLK